MPVEIKELVIRCEIVTTPERPRPSREPAGATEAFRRRLLADVDRRIADAMRRERER